MSQQIQLHLEILEMVFILKAITIAAQKSIVYIQRCTHSLSFRFLEHNVPKRSTREHATI
jgi:hypothetical protein